MAAPALAPTATGAQAVAYLNAEYGTTRYTNAAKTPYQGMTAAQIYAYLARQNPGASPYGLAVASADLILSSGVGQALGAAQTAAGGVIGATATGVSSASYLPSLTSLLGALGNRNLWVRAAKVIIGGTLVIVGLAHITGADNAVAAAARKVPVPV